jgi:hypothetical protein
MNMSDKVLAAVASRASVRRTQIDVGDVSPPQRASLLGTADVAASEAALGFPVPEVLKQLYQTVGNGGFGPGYGLIGLYGGALDDQGMNAVELYQSYATSDPEDPHWRWPDGLLPICHWGCAIYSCIDCRSAGHPIITFDPNMRDQSWAKCFVGSKHNLATWLQAWASGIKLWEEIYGEQQEP